MKKLLLTAAALTALTTTARADDRPTLRDYLEFNPYIGADYEHTALDYKDGLDSYLADTQDGGDLHIGNRFNKFVGLELGGFYNPSQDKNSTPLGVPLHTTVKTYGGTLDLLGYLPVGPQDKFDLIGTGGVTYTKAKLDYSIPGFASGGGDQSEWGWRAGGGLQFHVTPNFNIRGLVRYQSADFSGVANGAVTYTLGANFEF